MLQIKNLIHELAFDLVGIGVVDSIFHTKLSFFRFNSSLRIKRIFTCFLHVFSSLWVAYECTESQHRT